MSLQFIFGNSGSGKSHHLFDRIIKESIEHPEQNFIVLVPEQFTMQTQRELVMRHPRRGIMNIDVLSFARLAFRVFEETGVQVGTVLDDEGKNLILRRIAGEVAPSLQVLGANIKKMGYISEVKSVISELAQYSIHPHEMDALVEAAGPESWLSWKLRDIQKIYEAFDAYLEEKYITREELLDVLCAAVSRSERLKNSTVALDGFTGFTPVQMKVMGELMRHCRKVFVTVTMDGRTERFGAVDKYELFALGKEMTAGLLRKAREGGVEIEPEITLFQNPVYRFRHAPALAFLEAELFRYRNVTYTGRQDAVRIYCARNPQEEVRAAAQRIRCLVREKGYRFREIAVITADMHIYGEVLEKEFASYGIPVFMDYKRNVLLNAFVEYIRSLLEMAEQGFTPDGVFRFLRSGLTGFAPEELDRLENYVLALGIRGYKKWQEKWIRRAKTTTEEELELLNHLRVQFVEKMEPLLFVFRQRRKTVRDITEALYRFLVQEEIQQQLKQMENHFQQQGEPALAKEYAQIYRVVLELFDKFVALLGEEQMGLKEYGDLLDAGFAEARVGVIPPGIDEVVAGDLERTRLRDIRALLLLGVNDTLIPGAMSAGGLLSERDRERLEEADIKLAPGIRQKASIQKFYLYLYMTKPTEELDLFYSRVSQEGKSVRPAYLIGDIRRLYPKIKVFDMEEYDIRFQELCPETGIQYLIRGLQDPRMLKDSSWQEIYRWYVRQPEWRERVQKLLDASLYRRDEGWVSDRSAEILYGPGTPGVTRLERFSACACAHFLTYGLRLQERELFQFEALDFGNIFHRALEKYAGKLQEAGIAWTEVDESRQKRLVEESVDESIVDYHNTVLYGSSRTGYMIPRMKRLLARTVWALTRQLERGDFHPEGYEVNFGSGKIDRIDICENEDKVYVKILDYKTGNQEFDLSALYYGLQMQLAVYMGEALRLEEELHPGKEAVPAGIFYYRMKDPLVEKIKDPEKREEAILRNLRLDGMVNGDPEVVKRLDHTFQKTSTVIPVTITNTGYAAYSKVLEEEQFYQILDFVREKRKTLETEMRGGRAEAAPYQMGNRKACDFCPYRRVCGFDEGIEGCSFRKLRSLGITEVLERLNGRQEE